MDELVEIGRVLRTHGLKGEVTVRFEERFLDAAKELEIIFIQIDAKPVPFFIAALRPHTKSTLLFLEGVNDEATAKRLQGQAIYAQRLGLDMSEVEIEGWEYITGYQVHDKQIGALGKVVRVEESPAHPLLIVEYLGQEVMIPMMPPILREMDEDKELIEVDCPPGLLDLYTS